MLRVIIISRLTIEHALCPGLRYTYWAEGGWDSSLIVVVLVAVMVMVVVVVMSNWLNQPLRSYSNWFAPAILMQFAH